MTEAESFPAAWATGKLFCPPEQGAEHLTPGAWELLYLSDHRLKWTHMLPPSPSERAIRDRVGSRSFSRGKRYYEQGAIVSPRLIQHRLTAQCYGTASQPYRLWVELSEDGVNDAECSCPVGTGGFCKHVAALLLTWLHNPEAFQETQSADAQLAQLDKQSLILLIRQMIARHPDLEELVHVTATSEAATLNEEVIRAKVQQAIEASEYGHADFHAASALAGELAVIVQQGAIYEEAQEWQKAATVYSVVVETLLENYHEMYDHDGDLFTVFYSGAEKLGEYLRAISDGEERRAILRTLTNVVFQDIDLGGYGFADEAYVTIMEQATPEEKAQIATWIEAELAGRESVTEYDSGWSRQELGRFQLELLGDTVDDERFIELCRRSQLLSPLLERLLVLDRRQEAIGVAQDASDYDLINLADIFLAHGLGTTAEELLWERTAHSSDPRLGEWLKKYAASSKDWRRALRYAARQFSRSPSLSLYNEIRKYAEETDDWFEQRKKLIADLAATGRNELLIRIHLREDNIEEALSLLDKLSPYQAFGFQTDGGLGLEVAAAAEATHPRDALRIYREKIERLINARGRENYAIAARLLKRVRSLYRQLEEPDAWDHYISAVRKQKPRLPALLDELQKAGI